MKQEKGFYSCRVVARTARRGYHSVMKYATQMLFLIAILAVAACASLVPPEGALPPDDAATPMTTAIVGRVAGAPIRRTPTPNPVGETMQSTHGVTVAIVRGVEGPVVNVYSETGIGRATILLPAVGNATPVKLRLHLRGLEGWRFTFDNLSIFGAISTGDGSVSESVQIGDALDTPTDEASLYWMEVVHVSDESATDGYFELLLPSAFLESGLNSFTVSFVDFYR